MTAEPLRTLSWSTWLGWQIESNWADVRLFLLYMVVKPVCGALLLVAPPIAALVAMGPPMSMLLALGESWAQ